MMDRHKKYTNLGSSANKKSSQSKTGSVVLPDGSQALESLGIEAQPASSEVLRFEELDLWDVKDDPDFPPEFRTNIDLLSNPTTAPPAFPSMPSMLFQQLTSSETSRNAIDVTANSQDGGTLNNGQSAFIEPDPFYHRPLSFSPDQSIEAPSTSSARLTWTTVGMATGPEVAHADPEPGTSSGLFGQNPFHVNTNMISSVPMMQQASELQDLGLTVFNQEELEQGIIAQVDQVLAEQEKQRANKFLEKEQEVVQNDLRIAKLELSKLEKVLEMFGPQSQTNKDVNRRLKAVKQQKENKMKQIKKIKAKLKSIVMKLKGTTEDMEDDVDQGEGGEGSSVLTQSLGMQKAETEEERMIRLGEMTPFGTVMGFIDPVLCANMPKKPKEPPKPRVLTSDVSDFDNYLRDQQKKSVSKNKKKVVRKITPENSVDDIKVKEEKIDKPIKTKKRKSGEMGVNKPKKSKNSSNTPNSGDSGANSKTSSDNEDASSRKALALELGKKDNLYDSRDKRVYRGTEADFSRLSSRGMQHERLEHNFSEDGEMSDYEVGDEDQDEDVYARGDSEYKPEADLDMYGRDELAKSPGKKKNFPLKKHNRPVYKDEEMNSDDDESSHMGIKRKAGKNSNRIASRDDGCPAAYQRRLRLLANEKEKKQKKIQNGEEEEEESNSDSDMEFESGFKMHGKLWNKLYRYQKTGVRWLWELHCQQAGGIVGDEMGLGKTIQIIAFLSGLKYSQLRDKGENTKYVGLGPTIIITPATVMHQWVKEFHKWQPEFRVAILHSSGSSKSSAKQLVHNIVKGGGILVTAFSTVVIHQELLHKYDWHYVILDEGHKIRNPDAQITMACKMFRTSHRLILSGSPMQNNLKELWSLFDFVFPGKLGTLPDFMAHFSVPIVQGGYSNATEVQVQTAYKCACVLRDTINPYLLRRMKADVQNNINLPDKNEQVLFCRLTEHQRDVYQEYLDSRECKEILDRNFMVFPGLITLRKVCNHPDISTGGPKIFDPDLLASNDPSLEYGFWKRSGKMMVVESLLKLWKKQGHRVLLFSQSREMLNILETFVTIQGYTYMRMDGTTTIASRQPLIQKYNEDPSVFVFLLTTRVGGLGVNLTGANRVVIYDPDWNPSTDTQARERAWRIGQTKQVTIYRLLTTGTIEEKIYHRQIFKQFLSNRVLKDPKQRRFFKTNDLYDLFSLGDDGNPGTETSAIFAGIQSEVTVKVKARDKGRREVKDGKPVKKNRFDILKEKAKKQKVEASWSDADDEKNDVDADAEERMKKMKEMVKKLSKKLSSASTSTPEGSMDADGSNGNKDSELHETDKGKATKTKSKKKDKRRKKKKNKKEDAELEGEKISYLDRHGTFHRQDEEEQNDRKKGDEYVLEKLFRKNGVHSALQHDKIMMSSNPDYALVEGEANRVAKEAARALKRSRAQCMRAGTGPGVPTWTGQSGGATPQEARPRFGKKKNPRLASDAANKEKGNKSPRADVKPSPSKPKTPEAEHLFDGSMAGNVRTSGVPGSSASSAPVVMSSDELLSRMKARKNIVQKPNAVDDDDEDYGNGITMVSKNEIDPVTMELMTDLRNFVAFGCTVDGQASTQELLDQFTPRLPAGESAKFKAMLKNICEFRRKDGIGFWRLKQEFR